MTCCADDEMQSLSAEYLCTVVNMALLYRTTAWRNRYAGVRVPSKPNIYNMKNNLMTHGTVDNRNNSGSGHPRTGRLASNIAAVQRELHQNPRASSRCNGVPNVSRSFYLHIIKKFFNWNPYKTLS